jgi:hypothetical protein
MHSEPIAHIEFLGGALCPIYEKPSGRQYVSEVNPSRY